MKAHMNKHMVRVGSSAALASVMAFASPVIAFAEERETEGISAILPVMDEFIPMIVAFLILLAILVKFGWPLFDKVLVTRENTIRLALEQAEEARIEGERVLGEYKKQLDQARQESATIIAEAKQAGEAIRSDMTAQAQAEAEQIVAKAREAIEVEKKAAIGDLQSSVADLTVAAMTRVIGEDFSDADHRRLIERSLEEVGNLNV